MPNLQGKFQIGIKTALLKLKLSITELADSTERPRSTVSQAINYNRFPRVREQISRKLAELQS